MEEQKAPDEAKALDEANHIAQIVAAIVDQKVAGRIQQLEAKQAKTDSTMEQLPALVQQFQAMLPQLINQAVQQQVAGLLRQMPQAAAPSLTAPSPPSAPAPGLVADGGAGRIPLGMGPATAAPGSGAGEGTGRIPLGMSLAAPAEAAAAPAVSANLPAVQEPKASDLVKQMAGMPGGLGGLAGLLGGGGGNPIQDMVTQMIFKKLLGGEEKPPANPMEMLMGMANMVNQFADAMGTIVQSVDRIRGGFLEQRMQEAQITKVEAEGEATVLRALNQKAKAGGKSA